MRKCNLVTLCLPEVPGDTTPEHNMERAIKLLDAVKSLQPDLVVLPEVFQKISVNLPINDGDLTNACRTMLGEKARELNSYIVLGLHEIIDGKKCNVAWLLGRDGNLAGRYIKHRPTDYEMEKGVCAGTDIPVFETDFGRLGILICFDIDWSEPWQELADKGAEIVAWISAYDGGYPLNAYAAIHKYYVASSVRAFTSKIIDITGKELESSTRWANWAYKKISLDKTMFHIDSQFHKLAGMVAVLGNKIRLETYDAEGRFTIESNDPEWPVERIKKEFGLETFKEYHDRSAKLNDNKRLPSGFGLVKI